MPSIPIYQQQTQAAGSFGASADASSFGGLTAQAGSRLAGAMDDVGTALAMKKRADDHLLKVQEEKDGRSWAGTATSKAALDWAQTLQDRKNTALPGAPDFTGGLLTEFDDYASKLIDNAPTQAAKEFARQHMTAMRTQLGEQAISFQGQAKVSLRVDNAQTTIDNWSKVVQQDPGQYGKAMQAIRETTPDVDPVMQQKLNEHAIQTLTNAAASHFMDADPYAVQEATSKAMGDKGFTGKTGVAWVDDATAEQVKTWNSAATTKIHMLESEMARNADARDKVAQSTFNDATDLTFKGQFFSDTYKTQLRAAVKGTQWSDAAEELIRSQATTAGFASAPAGDRNAVLNTMASHGADPTQGTNPESAKQLAKIEAINTEIGKAVSENWVTAAQKYGVTKDATAFNIATPDDALRVIGQRAQTQTQAEGWAGDKKFPGGALTPLQPQEAVQLGNVLSALPPPARAVALAKIGDALPFGRRLALAAQLDPKDRPLALALQVTDQTTAGRQLSELILRGSQDLKDKTVKKDDSALSGWRSTIAGMVRDAGLSPQAEDAAIDSAYYVRASMENDGTALPGFKLSATEQQAVKMVLGQPMSRNGVKTFLPRGMDSEGDFDRALGTYTADTLKAAAPEGAFYVRGQPITLERFADSITRYGMRADGKGNYLPSSGGALVTTDKAGTQPLRLPVAAGGHP